MTVIVITIEVLPAFLSRCLSLPTIMMITNTTRMFSFYVTLFLLLSFPLALFPFVCIAFLLSSLKKKKKKQP